MQAVSNGRVDLVSRVMVGKPQTPTPVVQTHIRAIDFYPHWHVPQSIVKRALVPALKKNPNYLIRERIRVFESWGGREVDARRINWRSAQKNSSYVYRQDPGRFNALGVIRIDMPNNENVYMHDTPMKKLFRYNLRPYSAGCVRVQKIVGLTEWLLKGQGSWNRPRINTTIVAEAQSSVTLSHHVPVYFSYITAWARPNGIAHFRSDIYNKDIQNVKMANADMRK